MKKLVALLLAGVMTLSLAACGNQSSKSEDKKETSKSEETVEISFWHAMSGANEEAIQKITDDFMKENPNIKVNLMNQGDYLDLFDKLMASAKAKQLPNLAQIYSNRIVRATEEAGYKAGEEVSLALDVAATELYDRSFKKYVFEGESKTKDYKVIRSSEELIDYYEGLIEQFPIVSIEDPLDEEDWDGWELLTTRLGLHTQLVGDDLFVTNTKRLKKGIEKEVANAILIKVNQIGTLTEALDTIEMAQKAGYRTIVSHRSGETADTLIADLAVAVGAGQIKTGAPCRSERVEKYNQLLRIEERLGDVAEYQNPFK